MSRFTHIPDAVLALLFVAIDPDEDDDNRVSAAECAYLIDPTATVGALLGITASLVGAISDRAGVPPSALVQALRDNLAKGAP